METNARRDLVNQRHLTSEIRLLHDSNLLTDSEGRPPRKMNMRFKFNIPSTLAVLLCFFMVNESFSDVHVSVTGDDESGNGSEASPFKTLTRAFQVPDDIILMESGEYILPAGLQVPQNKIIIGGFKRVAGEYLKDSSPTLLLAVGTPGAPALVLKENARLEWVTFIGGFYSVELSAGSQMTECKMLGGQLAAVYARFGSENNPAIVDRCQILGGGSGIRVEGDANVTVRHSVIRDTQSRGIYVSGSGEVLVENSSIYSTNSDGITIVGNDSVLISNSLVRDNVGDGIRVTQASPTIRGCVVERNRDGLNLNQVDGLVSIHNTIVNNRENGIYLSQGQCDFLRNVISHNGGYGIFEDKPEDIVEFNEDGTSFTITFPIHTNALTDNLFFGNSTANYLDEGQDVYNSENEINAFVLNSSVAEGNRVADPMYLDRSGSRYTPREGSPLIDQVDVIVGYDRDVLGNERAIDIESTGEAGVDVVDLGAVEYDTRSIWNFGGQWSRLNSVPQPAAPGGFTDRYSSGEFEHVESPFFFPIEAEFLPGKIRMTSRINGSFGFVERYIDDLHQFANKIIVIRSEFAAFDPTGNPFVRTRVNGPATLDLAVANGYAGDDLRPESTGEEWELVLDLRQGGYKNIPQDQITSYSVNLAYDLVDFLGANTHNPQDLTRLEIEEYDRAIFEAQYTQLEKSWTFGTSDPIDWRAEFISGGIFANPRMRYNPTREALEIQQQVDNSFAWWVSPDFEMGIGEAFVVELHVSSGQPLELSTGFRARISSKGFEFTTDLISQPFVGSFAGPDDETLIYNLYGRIPEAFTGTDADKGGVIDCNIYFDLWGFGFDGRPKTANLFLEEVNVRVAENPIY